MSLTAQQIIQRIKQPVNADALQKGAEDNDRQRFHSKLAGNKGEAGPYYAKFIKYIGGVLDELDRPENENFKTQRFESLMTWPLTSSRMVSDSADGYSKCFTAEDRLIETDFTDEALSEDWQGFLAQIRFEDTLRKRIFTQALQAANAVWVVDLPQVQKSDYPEPAILIREFGAIKDIEADKFGGVACVIYSISSLVDADGKETTKRWVGVDDQSYRLIHQPINSEAYTVHLDILHNLGRCPAGFVWHEVLDPNSPLRRESPIHGLMGSFDEFIATRGFREHSDTYAAWKIIRQYKTKCDYVSNQGERCEEGVVRIIHYYSDGITAKGSTSRACPSCSKRKPIGPGTTFKVPMPTSKDQPDLKDPIGFVEGSREILDYVAEKIKTQEESLHFALTGDRGNVDQTAQPVNADQVAARIESRKDVVKWWATNMERVNAELFDALAGLRYGDQYLGSTVNYGDEFHLVSVAEAELAYLDAQNKGMPMYILGEKRAKLTSLIAGASERRRLRLDILSQLEPYPDVALSKVQQGTPDHELKAGFSSYIARFEREYLPIEQVALGKSMAARITFIRTELLKYVKETMDSWPVPDPVDQPFNSNKNGKAARKPATANAGA
ncbi:hypothetical protein [Tellurirhabdus bombi]|uniref:hypothetical protein n=1 Tax=Tellurirhabdus bombi TaxID=2907205 RepID=UPI001F258EAB|nr:hypothetical protein [Tellurirhabdus bombi]